MIPFLFHLSFHFIDSLECPSCGFKKQSNVTYQDVPLNLAADKSSGIFLTELLQNFCAEEILDSNNLWTCSKCSGKVAAKKSTQFDSLPSTLFLHMKRFTYDQVAICILFSFIFSYRICNNERKSRHLFTFP